MIMLAPPDKRTGLRTSSEIKSLIARSAATTVVSPSAFMIAAAQERAKHILAESETLTLLPRDWNALFSTLDMADQPRPVLKTAATEYLAWGKKQIGK